MAGGGIFICYRRSDAPGYVQALLTRLQTSMPSATVFVDVDGIAPGADFQDEINRRVAESEIVLAVIGKDWLDARDAQGERRLDNPDDYVRLEIETAIAQRKRLIPVLLDNAALPKRNQLPEGLHPLIAKQAVPLRHDTFRADVDGFVDALGKLLRHAQEQPVSSGSHAQDKARAAEADRIAQQTRPQPVQSEGAVMTHADKAFRFSVVAVPGVQVWAVILARNLFGTDDFAIGCALFVPPLAFGIYLGLKAELSLRGYLGIGILLGAVSSASLIFMAVFGSSGRPFNNYLLFIVPGVCIPLACVCVLWGRWLGRAFKVRKA